MPRWPEKIARKVVGEARGGVSIRRSPKGEATAERMATNGTAVTNSSALNGLASSFTLSYPKIAFDFSTELRGMNCVHFEFMNSVVTMSHSEDLGTRRTCLLSISFTHTDSIWLNFADAFGV